MHRMRVGGEDRRKWRQIVEEAKYNLGYKNGQG